MPDGGLATTDVLILVGGRGTRLQSLPGDIPKPLRPVDGKPFLHHLLEQVRRQGAHRVILALGYRYEDFRDLLAHPPPGLEVEASVESSPMGTGGALRQALPHIRSESALVLNGDSFVDADFRPLEEMHRRVVARVSILLVPVPDATRFGTVTRTASGEVTGFHEKGRSGPGSINAGVYIFRREVIAEIPEGRVVSLETGVFPSQIGRRFFAHETGARFIDIGTPETYRDAERFFQGLRGDRP